jgi:hypothetical protein
MGRDSVAEIDCQVLSSVDDSSLTTARQFERVTSHFELGVLGASKYTSVSE